MEATTVNHPLRSARLGVVSAAVWQNHDDQGNARGLSVSLTKRYYDRKADQWANSRIYLAPDQIAAAIAVLASIQEQLLTLDGNDTE